MPSEVYNEEFYTMETRMSLRCAQIIAPLIYEMFKPKSVIDIGCGAGTFLRSFGVEGVDDVLGLDGDYVPRHQLLIPPEQFRPTDLSKPFSAGRRYDLVMCLEVGEHLDAPVADQFVDNLCQHGDVIVFSAAIPLQMGNHHVNEQWQSYWVKKFMAHGYTPFDLIRPRIWADDSIEVFYKQNIVVFANAAAIARFPDVLVEAKTSKEPKSYDLVHPDMYAMRCGTVQSLGSFIAQMADANRPFRIRRTEDGSFAADKA